MMMLDTQQYGFYSAQADRQMGHNIYATSEGRHVKVTYLSADLEGSGYMWSDKVCVGPVVKHVESHACAIGKYQKILVPVFVDTSSSMREISSWKVSGDAPKIKRPMAGPGSLPKRTAPPAREWWKNR